MAAPQLQNELRFWPELAGLLSDPRFWSPGRRRGRPPVLLTLFGLLLTPVLVARRVPAALILSIALQ